MFGFRPTGPVSTLPPTDSKVIAKQRRGRKNLCFSLTRQLVSHIFWKTLKNTWVSVPLTWVLYLWCQVKSHNMCGVNMWTCAVLLPSHPLTFFQIHLFGMRRLAKVAHQRWTGGGWSERVNLVVCTPRNWQGLVMLQHPLQMLQNVSILLTFCTESRQWDAYTDPCCIYWPEDACPLHPLAKGHVFWWREGARGIEQAFPTKGQVGFALKFLQPRVQEAGTSRVGKLLASILIHQVASLIQTRFP